MKIITNSHSFSTQGDTSIINMTEIVQTKLHESGLQEGQITIFAIGSTTGLTTIEYEPGLVHTDVAEMYDKIAPYQKEYAHNQTWGDDNGAAHLRSCITGTHFVCPFTSGRLILGTWQQIVFIDFDTRPRDRRIVIQLIGQ